MFPADRPDGFVDALANGLAVLCAFDSAHAAMSLTEIARQTGLTPATARRSLITLAALGYVSQTGKRFHLRPRILTLGSGFAISAQLGAVLRPELNHLVQRFGGVASVATLDAQAVICLENVSSSRSTNLQAINGARYPVLATAIGRMLLSGFTEERLDTWLDDLLSKGSELRHVLPDRPLDRPALRAEIRSIRCKGHATAQNEIGPGLSSLAVPIRDLDGTVIAALNTVDESGRQAEDLVRDRLAEVTAVASRISLNLSRSPILTEMLRPDSATPFPT